MTDEPAQARDVSLIRLFPWLRLSQAAGLSFDPKKLFLGAAGLLLLHAGWYGLGQAFPRSTARLTSSASPFPPSGWSGPARGVLAPTVVLWELAEPALVVIGPFLDVFAAGADGVTFLHALLSAVWAVAVWGIVGGAIARVAAVQVATGERIGMGAALRFAMGKTVPLIGGPLSPLLGVAVVATPCLALGLLYRGPDSFGELMAAAFLVVPLLCGLLMTFILAGLAAGWPLVLASVAAEAQDGFDALSRSYAYVYQRLGRYAAYVVLAALVGIVGYWLVTVFAEAVVSLACWGLSWTADRSALQAMLQPAPVTAERLPAQLHAFWLGVVRLLVHGWVYSYFWSAAVMVYLLIRHDVDGTDWYQVAVPPAGADPFAPGYVAARGKGLPVDEPA